MDGWLAGRTSRRRLLGGAAAITAMALLPSSLHLRHAAAQSTDPAHLLLQIFTADAIDPSLLSPALQQPSALQQLQMAVTGVKGLFGAVQDVQASGDGTYLVLLTGGTVSVHAAFDDSGLLAGLFLIDVTYALAPDEQEVQFQNGGETLYGTLLLPNGIANPPGALLIAGSGPTDRNGNSPLLPVQVNTLANIARTLATAGIASLRYDKLGTGKTGSAGHQSLADIDFDTFINEALAAYTALAARPQIDLTRMLAVGHSEGTLLALLIAQQTVAGTAAGAPPPSALILAAPLGRRLLDVVRRQLLAQADAARSSGEFSADEYTTFVADVDRTIASIRQNGTIPPGVFSAQPDVLQSLFSAANAPALQQEDTYDPAMIAAGLPPTLPALVIHGSRDTQVTQDDVMRLLHGFAAAGNVNAPWDELPDVDHALRLVPPGQDPLLTVSYPFAPAVADALTTFVTSLFPGTSTSAPAAPSG